MTKKSLSFIALVLILAVSAFALTACNSYDWDSIGTADAEAEVYSNGGYFVRQGNFAYFINGFVGDNDDNEWGTPLKQGIMRAEINADGTVNNDTAKLLVPKSIYNGSVNGGIAVFGEWVYYATPNNDKDKSGTASTTHTDFMRTKTDGSVTQLIGTINSRTSEYLFTPSRVLYYISDDSKIYYFDFSGMKTNKSIENGSGAVSGTLAENVGSVAWSYSNSYEGKDSAADYIFYTETLTGDNSYEFYNNTYAVKYDGTGKTLLITNTSYFENDADAENYSNFPEKVFKVSLNAVKDEGDFVTLYYNKSINLNSTETAVGLYCNKFDAANGFGALKGADKVEKQLTTNASTTLMPISYNDGAIAYNSSNQYCWFNGETSIQTTDTSTTVWAVSGDYAYFTANSSAKELCRTNYKQLSNVETVLTANIKVDWLKLEFDGNMFYYFDADDYNYLHYINVSTYNDNDKDAESVFIGKMNEADLKSKKEAEEK